MPSFSSATAATGFLPATGSPSKQSSIWVRVDMADRAGQTAYNAERVSFSGNDVLSTALLPGEASVLDRLSPTARDALVRAEAEARQLGHDHVGTDHLLIGLADQRGGVAARILDSLGLTAEKLRSSVAFVRGRESDPSSISGSPELQYTPRLQHAIERAAQEAARRNQQEVGTLHLLLAVVRERQGLAVLLVEVPGVGLERIGAEMSRAVREGAVDENDITEG